MRHIAAIFRGAANDCGHRVPFQNRQTGIATGRKRCENDQITGGRCRSNPQRQNSVGFGGRDGCRKVLPVTFFGSGFVLDQ
jgi:hypothetical protein